MAKRVKVKANKGGIIDLLHDPGVADVADDAALQIHGRLPQDKGYEVVYGDRGKTRHHALVVTDDFKAKLDNARNATLLRALGGA